MNPNILSVDSSSCSGLYIQPILLLYFSFKYCIRDYGALSKAPLFSRSISAIETLFSIAKDEVQIREMRG